MMKLRTISWFLLLVILLATLVSFTLAQETPTAAEGRLFQQDSSALPSGEPMARSVEENQAELSTNSRLSISPSTVAVDLFPMAGDDGSPEPTGLFDTSGLNLPAEWQNPPPPMTSSPLEPIQDVSSEHLPDISGLHVSLPQSSPSPSALGDNCTQLIVNPNLNPSGSFADPWDVLLGIIYLTPDAYVSPEHSLAFMDNDVDDSSPNYDFFAQTVMVPSNLTSARFDFSTLALNSDESDLTIVSLWTVDVSGIPDEIIDAWRVNPTAENTWEGWFVEITDKTTLQQLQGQDIALGFSSETTASAPNEIIFFDNITFDVCQPDAPNSYIIVKKETDPDGASQNFTFAPSWGSNFQLADGGSNTSPALPPGTYSVKELAQPGWNLDSATCSNGNNPNSISLQAGQTVTCTFKNVQETVNQDCRQMLVNTTLAIDEFGDGTGSAEPWSIIFPRVYYTNVEGRAYDGYSLVLKDGDDDPSPDVDMFAQGFLMPNKLTELKIEYQRATLNTNAGDKVYGQLYLLDDDWVLHWPSDEYFAGEWTVTESEGTWQKEIITADDPTILNKVAGQKVAILLFNITDNAGDKEEVLFDDISLTACSQSAPGSRKVYMPSIMQKFGKPSGPICTPPNENPADQFHSNRGLVQTGATCTSTLSNVDRRDYYTFTPTTSGNHTLRLSNLPAGTEWAATIWLDIAKPTYAPGNSKDGICFTDQHGSGDKQVVCNLNKGAGYFVRIDSGSTPQAGSYTMRVTAP